MKKTTIFFDLDNTLIDRTTAATKGFNLIVDETFGKVDEEFKQIAVFRLLELDKNGSVSKFEVFNSFATEYNLDSAWAKEKADFWYNNITYWTIPFEKAEETLKELKKQFKLGLISNGDVEIQYAKLDRSGLWYLFDATLVSLEIDLYKPDAKVFLEGCKRIGCQPQEAYFVGDNIKCDIEGSRNVGMSPIYIWKDPSVVYEGVPRIYSIEEIIDVV